MTTSDPSPSTTPSRWLPVVGFTLVASANQMMWLNFSPITTGTASRLGVSTSAIGWLSEIFPLLYVVLALPVGRALDRWFRPTLAGGTVLMLAGALLRLGGGGYGWLLAGQVLIAVAQPAVLNAITGTATHYLAEHHRPLGIAVGSAGTFAGFIEGFALGGALGARHLHTILVVSAIYTAVAAAVLGVGLRSRVHAHPAVFPATTARKEVIRGLLADRVMRNTIVIVFVGFGAFIALSTWAETLLKPAGISSAHTDTLLVVMVLAGVVGCALIPPLAAGRGLQPQVIGVSAVTIVTGCVVLAAAPGLVAAAVVMPVLGFLLLPNLPVILEMAERRAGQDGGTATALLWLSGNAGGIVVALAVQGLQSDPAAAFGLLAGLGCIAGPLAVTLRRQLGAGTPLTRLS